MKVYSSKHRKILERLLNCPVVLQQWFRRPANPFMTKIVDGKCSCMPPQVCDE